MDFIIESLYFITINVKDGEGRKGTRYRQRMKNAKLLDAYLKQLCIQETNKQDENWII